MIAPLDAIQVSEASAFLAAACRFDGAGGETTEVVTVTGAEADFVLSAALVAVSVYVPAVVGAA